MAPTFCAKLFRREFRDQNTTSSRRTPGPITTVFVVKQTGSTFRTNRKASVYGSRRSPGRRVEVRRALPWLLHERAILIRRAEIHIDAPDLVAIEAEEFGVAETLA